MYFCLIETSVSPVPHLEILQSDGLAGARAEARLRLHAHRCATAAHLYEGSRPRGVVRNRIEAPEGAGTAGR